MCGIAGIAGSRTDASTLIVPMLSELRFRGPDSQGWFGTGPTCIGQTRLRVIDLVSGDPPITNEDETVCAVLNGEIYNYRELADDLRSRGHVFSSSGDTETIAHLAEDAEPAEIARRLEGMFAFAVWDERRGRLVLGRDRPGKKPLYYWTDGRQLVFASEIKSLLRHPDVPARLDPRAVPAYLTFGAVPTPATFYDEIRSLPPAHVLVWESGREPLVERYWELPRSSGERPSLQQAGARVRQLLSGAVRRRLRADVPLGAFLSGGIDSSVVVGLMAEASISPVRTFTIGFEDEEGFDERPYAALVARHFGTEHHEFVVKPADVDLIERLVLHYDEPFGDSSALPTYLLSELTRQHVTVALSGDGGDEVFGGYERFGASALLDRYRMVPVPARYFARRAARLVPRGLIGGRAGKLSRVLERAELPRGEEFLTWISYADPAVAEALVGAAAREPIDRYADLFRSLKTDDRVATLLRVNFSTYLPDDLLPKIDRMSMAHALEVRSPFLDRELTEYALSLPGRSHVRGLSLKRTLKEAARGLVPDEILARPKHGFGVPLARWFRADLRDYMHGLLGSRAAAVRRLVAADALDAILAEHDSGARDHQHLLWALLTLELFLKARRW